MRHFGPLPEIAWKPDPRVPPNRGWVYEGNGFSMTIQSVRQSSASGMRDRWAVTLAIPRMPRFGSWPGYTTAASARRGAARLIRRLDRIAGEADLPLFSRAGR